MRDTVLPDRGWRFDSDVADAFDDMLQRSIPQYELMRHAVFELGARYVDNGTAIVDLGCSRGEALAPFVERFGSDNAYLGIELSDPMLEVARRRFADSHSVRIEKRDLRYSFDVPPSSVVLSILTLQFVPIEYRQSLLRDVFDALRPGGAFLLVEKVLGNTSALDDAFVDAYLEMKVSNGYTQEQIQRKRLALEGVLVPVTAKWNEDMLGSAGFTRVDCFWRWMNFAGWVALK